MAIDGFRLDEPLYISSAGSADEVKIEHNGSDFYLINDTGNTYIQSAGTGSITIIDNGVLNSQFTIDHSSGNVGIGTNLTSYGLELQRSGTGAMMVSNRTDGAAMELSGSGSSGVVGTRAAHPVDIRTNIISRINIDTSGNVKIPAAFVTTIGGTNADLYIDSTGLIGPNPSSERFKENIREPADIDTNWIYNVEVKKYDMKPERGGEKDKIGVIAEEIETINKIPIRYGIHEVTENGPVLLNGSEYDFSQTLGLQPGIARNDIPILRRSVDSKENNIAITEYKQLILLPISVNLSDFIIPILKEVQILKNRIDILEENG